MRTRGRIPSIDGRSDQRSLTTRISCHDFIHIAPLEWLLEGGNFYLKAGPAVVFLLSA